MTRPYHRHAMDPAGQRWCPRCEQLKPLALFTVPSGRRMGHCQPCRRAVTNQWRARHHAELKARRRARYPGRSTGPNYS